MPEIIRNTPDGVEYELPYTNEVQFEATYEKKTPTLKVLNVKDHAFPAESAEIWLKVKS